MKAPQVKFSRHIPHLDDNHLLLGAGGDGHNSSWRRMADRIVQEIVEFMRNGRKQFTPELEQGNTCIPLVLEFLDPCLKLSSHCVEISLQVGDLIFAYRLDTPGVVASAQRARGRGECVQAERILPHEQRGEADRLL